MNSTALVELTLTIQNSTMTTIEWWFIPSTILEIICTSLTIILTVLFLFIIIIDKTCHTVVMMLSANSCLTILISACILLSYSIFKLENDYKQIQYEDSLCIFRVYIAYFASSIFYCSFALQAFYRYILVVYPNRLFWQSMKFQIILICLTHIYAIVHSLVIFFTGKIIYNVDNQLCHVPFQLSFSLIYMMISACMLPISMIILIYIKLIRFVKEMSKRVTSTNILVRAKRELHMVRRIIILIMTLMFIGVPYMIIMFMSFFNRTPKYYYRIIYIFNGISILLVIIVLFKFTDPLKTSLMNRIKCRSNAIIAVLS